MVILMNVFPSVETIVEEMGIGKDTFYRYIKILVAAEVIEKRQTNRENGRFGRVIYRMVNDVPVSKKVCLPCTENKDAEKPYTDEPYTEKSQKPYTVKSERPCTENKGTKSNNNIKNNMTKNNYDCQQIADMYNDTCVSFPRLTKLSDRRRKAIRARLKSGYTLDDFRRLFELAESSEFLKGSNGRNWSATFDWLIQDGNMAKVLDGNYQSREPMQKGEKNNEKSENSYSVKIW